MSIWLKVRSKNGRRVKLWDRVRMKGDRSRLFTASKSQRVRDQLKPLIIMYSLAGRRYLVIDLHKAIKLIEQNDQASSQANLKAIDQMLSLSRLTTRSTLISIPSMMSPLYSSGLSKDKGVQDHPKLNSFPFISRLSILTRHFSSPHISSSNSSRCTSTTSTTNKTSLTSDPISPSHLPDRDSTSITLTSRIIISSLTSLQARIIMDTNLIQCDPTDLPDIMLLLHKPINRCLSASILLTSLGIPTTMWLTLMSNTRVLSWTCCLQEWWEAP